MADIREHMEVIGADGVHIGTVDKVEGNRIKLTRKDSGEGSHKGHHHFVDRGLVAGVEGNKVRLSAIGAQSAAISKMAWALSSWSPRWTVPRTQPRGQGTRRWSSAKVAPSPTKLF